MYFIEKILKLILKQKKKSAYYIPQDIELTLENFDVFIEKRKKLIFDKLSDLLNSKINDKADT